MILAIIAEALEKLPAGKYLYLNPCVVVDEYVVNLMGVEVRTSELIPVEIFYLFEKDPVEKMIFS